MYNLSNSSLIKDSQMADFLSKVKQNDESTFSNSFVVNGFVTHILKKQTKPYVFFLRIEFEWFDPIIISNDQFSDSSYAVWDINKYDCVSVLFCKKNNKIAYKIINYFTYLKSIKNIFKYLSYSTTQSNISKISLLKGKTLLNKVKFINFGLNQLLYKQNLVVNLFQFYKKSLYFSNLYKIKKNGVECKTFFLKFSKFKYNVSYKLKMLLVKSYYRLKLTNEFKKAFYRYNVSLFKSSNRKKIKKVKFNKKDNFFYNSLLLKQRNKISKILLLKKNKQKLLNCKWVQKKRLTHVKNYMKKISFDKIHRNYRKNNKVCTVSVRTGLKKKRFSINLNWRLKKKWKRKKRAYYFWLRNHIFGIAVNKYIRNYVKKVLFNYKVSLGHKATFCSFYFSRYIYLLKKKKEYRIQSGSIDLRLNSVKNNYKFILEKLWRLKISWFFFNFWDKSTYLVFSMKYALKLKDDINMLFYTLLNRQLYIEAINV